MSSLCLDRTGDDSVTFCELVEHPGGHDGGEFPQYHTYRGGERPAYETDYPECPTDVFTEGDLEEFVEVEDREGAIDLLTLRLAKLERSVAVLRQIIVDLQIATDLNIVTPEE